jgi:hypothetical protein
VPKDYSVYDISLADAVKVLNMPAQRRRCRYGKSRQGTR